MHFPYRRLGSLWSEDEGALSIRPPQSELDVKILIVDTSRYAPTTPLFADALKVRSTEGATIFDEAKYERSNSLGARIIRRISGSLAGASVSRFNRDLVVAVTRLRPRAVLVVKGSFVEPDTLRALKDIAGCILVNFATDDPFNGSACHRRIRECIPQYDYYACTKKAILPDVIAAGCPNAFYLPFAYQPSVHFVEQSACGSDLAPFDCDVAFVGGADKERTPFFIELTRRYPRIRLNLYGGYWERVAQLRRYARGFATGRDYRLATAGAKLSVNLVRRANRDGHVMRTFEVPAMGGTMVSERTEEHSEILGEGVEDALFSNPEELATVVGRLLENSQRRAEVSALLRERIIGGKNSYLDRYHSILGRINPPLCR